MKDLAGLKPSPALSSYALASALAAFLQDPDIRIREAAAGHLRGDRPADIAVPALIQALAGMDRSWDRLRRVVARIDAAAKPDRPTPKEIDDALALVSFPNALLASLRAYHDERAVTGVVQALALWKLDRTPGATIQLTCEELCLRGTQAALDAVVDLLTRAQSFVDPKRVRPSTDPKTPAAVLERVMRPLDAENVKQISAALDAAVKSHGIELPAAFDGSAAAWRDVLRNHAASIPKELPASRPASKPAPGR